MMDVRISRCTVLLLALLLTIPYFHQGEETDNLAGCENLPVTMPAEISNSEYFLIPKSVWDIQRSSNLANLKVIEIYDSFVMIKLTQGQKTLLWNEKVNLRPLTDRTFIDLSFSRFDTTMGEPQDIPWKINTFPDSEMGTYIVQFIGPVKESWTCTLQALSATVYDYIPNNAFIVKMDHKCQDAVKRLPFVQWTGLFQPAYKIDKGLYASKGLKDIIIETFESALTEPTAVKIAKSGGKILYSNEKACKIRTIIDSSLVPFIAGLSEVKWLEGSKDIKPNNKDVVWVVQSGVVDVKPIWDKGIHGEGQIAAASDTGIDVTHPAFSSKTVYYHNGPGANGNDTSAEGYHGTFTGCTQAGNDSANPNGRGVAYAADYSIYDLCSGSMGSIVNLDCFPTTYAELFDCLYADGARTCNNGWGSSNLGGYDSHCEEIDNYLWQKKDFMMFFPTGNHEGDDIVTTPASAKNVVAVGGTGNGISNMNNMAGFSSYGPTKDGRLKPDIVTPATVTSAVPSGTYAQMSGTSMSCPSAAGSALLIRQYFTEGWYPTGIKGTGIPMTNPSGALLKATLLNGGTEITGVGAYAHPYNGMPFPNNDQGWGRATLTNSLYFDGDLTGLFVIDDTSGLVTGENKEFEIPMSGAGEIHATLVWSDYPANPLAGKSLVNDIDLTVTDPASQVYKGNVFSTTTHKSATGGSYDTGNTVEGFRLGSVTGTWKFKVTATGIAKGPQPFALVIKGPITKNSGKIYLDRPIYTDIDVVKITVETNGVSSVNVNIKSNTEPLGEDISLTQSGSSGIWTGMINTDPITTPGDGKLGVTDGDTITAIYHDTDDHQATAHVDTGMPMISGVWVSEITDKKATVNWVTAKPANSTVDYGLTTSLGSVKKDDYFTLTHSIALVNLTDDSLYYFKLRSSTRTGKLTIDDNGGAFYTFTTSKRGNILFIDGSNRTDSNILPRYDDIFTKGNWTYSIWDTRTQGAPTRGDMKKYYAVIWETGSKYPQLYESEMAVIADYLELGGRFLMSSHDIAWDLGSNDSGSHRTPASRLWFWNTMKSYWNHEDANSTGMKTLTGKMGDPITGDWASSGVQFRITAKAAYSDDITQLASNPDGIPSFNVWNEGGMSLGMHWESANVHGTPGDGVWGGQKSRLVYFAFKMYEIDGKNNVSDTRIRVMNKTLTWLLDNSVPPYVQLHQPNGGEVLFTPIYNIKWSCNGSDVICIQYSMNGGQAWHDISGATGLPGTQTEFSWNIASYPPGTAYRVRIIANKTLGIDSLISIDSSDSNFTICIGDFISWLSGKVTDIGTGAPVKDAIVTVAGTGWSALTNASGSYNITVLGPATYFVTVTKAGYMNETKTGIIIDKNKTVFIDFQLQRALHHVIVDPPRALVPLGKNLSFTATAYDTEDIIIMDSVNYNWTVNGPIGTISPSVGSTITFTAMSTSASGTIELNASYFSQYKLGSSEIIVDASANAPPSCTIVYPVPSQIVKDQFSIHGIASDPDGNSGLMEVGIKIDTNGWFTPIGIESWNLIWNTSQYSNGPHIITARAIDNWSEIATTTVNVIVNNTGSNTAPICWIDAPKPLDSLKRIVKVKGRAQDADGNFTIVQVDVKVDAAGSWTAALGTTSWSYDLNTTLYLTGPHQIIARAYDGRNYSDEIIVPVIFNNTSPIPKSRIYGIVKDNETKLLLAGVLVELDKINMTTMSNGTFNFWVIEAGKHTIRASRSGYRDFILIFNTTETSDRYIEILLQPEKSTVQHPESRTFAFTVTLILTIILLVLLFLFILSTKKKSNKHNLVNITRIKKKHKEVKLKGRTSTKEKEEGTEPPKDK